MLQRNVWHLCVSLQHTQSDDDDDVISVFAPPIVCECVCVRLGLLRFYLSFTFRFKLHWHLCNLLIFISININAETFWRRYRCHIRVANGTRKPNTVHFWKLSRMTKFPLQFFRAACARALGTSTAKIAQLFTRMRVAQWLNAWQLRAHDAITYPNCNCIARLGCTSES